MRSHLARSIYARVLDQGRRDDVYCHHERSRWLEKPRFRPSKGDFIPLYEETVGCSKVGTIGTDCGAYSAGAEYASREGQSFSESEFGV